MAAALAGIREYWVAALEERRGEPEPRPGDLAAHLLHATYDGRPLTDAEMLDMLTVLVLAGLDTTRAELGYMFRHLAAHPEHRRALVDDPELIPSAVEEVAAVLHDHLRRRAQGDARRRVPRREPP